MSNLVVIKHAENEGPGSIQDYFLDAGWKIVEIDLHKGVRLPERLDSINAVVCMGGPMNVYEEEKYQFLRAEDIFIRRVIGKGVPFMGICLGSQLLAKAAGAGVVKAEEKEIGWYEVTLTEEGAADPLFKAVGAKLSVFQWHEDTFEIPPNGVLIATSGECRNQAFRIGRCAYGLQFHIEATSDMIKSWLSGSMLPVNVLEDTIRKGVRVERSFAVQANRIYENFLRIVNKADAVAV